MITLSLVGVVIFMLTSLVVGIRLLALWRRTRQLPELLLAHALLCIGFVGFAVASVVKLVLHEAPPSLVTWLPVVGLALEYSGVIALALFAWRVFHPTAAWARALTVAIILALLVAFLGEVVTRENLHYIDGSRINGPEIPFGLAMRALAPMWMSFECLRYHAMLRRRLSLGLAEPLVVDRFRLWGIAIFAASLGYVVSFVHRILYGTGIQAHTWAILSVSVFALVAAIGIALAFFPPRSYRRWIARRSGE